MHQSNRRLINRNIVFNRTRRRLIFVTCMVVLAVLFGSQLVGQWSPAEGSWTLQPHRCASLTGPSTASVHRDGLTLPASTLKYFPQAGRCMTGWMARYTQLQADVQSGRLPPRYLLSVSVEAGLADRLTGLITHLWHAVLTNRALVTVNYGVLPPFEAMCRSPFIEWSRRPENVSDEAVEPLKYTYKGQRGYPSDKRFLPANLDAHTFQMLYLINGPEEKLKVYQRGNISTAVSTDPAYLLAAANRGRTWALATNPFYKQVFWDFGVPPQDAFMCGFFFMCSPVAAIEQYYQKYWDALQEHGVLKIGIQIRVGDAVFQGAKTEQQPAEAIKIGAEWFDCAQQLEKAYAAPGQKVLWYLNADSKQLRKAAKLVYGDKLITDDELQMSHPDCHQNRAGGSTTCQQTAMDEALQHSLGAMLTFSLTDYHVITGQSGFGRLGAWLSGRWDNIYQVDRGAGGCSPGQPVRFEQSAYHYAGV